jgi:hypothetical protein
MMDTVRFSKVVETSGNPVVDVLWLDLAKDPVLKRAVDANRVMTLHQPIRHEHADYGTIGFQKGVPGQILIFLKSLRRFVNKRVLGIKYDLFDWPEVPKGQRADKALAVRHSGKRKPTRPPLSPRQPNHPLPTPNQE